MAVTAKEITKTLAYSTTDTTQNVLSDLEQFQDFDRQAEARLKRWRLPRNISAVCAIGLFALWLFTKNSSGAAAQIAPVAAAVCLVAWIVLWITVRVLSKFDLDDRRYALPQGLLSLLKADLRPDAPISVRLNLKRPDAGPVDQKYTNGSGWKIKEYKDVWLELSGQLVDGSKFHFSATERLRAGSRWKTNARGKTKHKTKKKTRHFFRLEVRRKTGAEQLKTLGQDVKAALQLPGWVSLKSAGATQKGVHVQVFTDTDWAVKNAGKQSACATHLSAMMFLSLFQIVNQSKAIESEAS